MDKATIKREGDDLVVIIPEEICEKLNIKEGTQVIIEPFHCGGEAGIRIKPKDMS